MGKVKRGNKKTVQLDLLQPAVPTPKEIERSEYPQCVLCNDPSPCQIHSALLEGSVHEKCHTKWLERIYRGKK